MIPIALSDFLWPEYRSKPLLKMRGFIFALFGLILVTVVGGVLFRIIQDEANPYHPDPVQILSTLFIVVFLIVLAYRGKNRVVQTESPGLLSPFFFGCGAFLFQAVNLVIPNVLAENGVGAPITIFAQVLLIAFVLLFLFFQVYHRNAGRRHAVALVFGSLLFFIVLAPVQEFGNTQNPDPTDGMTLVGVIILVLLLFWRRRVLRDVTEKTV
jgi:drug/metabolite transporter (DMT)-like permease